MYKPELKEEIAKLISDFFMEERGNRITSNNIGFFLTRINILLEKNKIEKKEE